MQRGKAIALSVLVWALCGELHAALVTFNFRSGTDPSSWVDSLSFSSTDSDGALQSLQVRAYSDDKVGVPGTSPEMFLSGKVRQFAGGLGACGANELLGGCINPSRPIDNDNREEWLFFTFATPVSFQSTDLTSFESRDYDVSYWFGTMTPALLEAGLEGRSFDDVYANAVIKAGTDVFDADMDAQLGFSLQGSGNFLLLGANRAYRQSPDGAADYLFVNSLTVQSPVPAPASILLFASGLIMLAGLRISRLS